MELERYRLCAEAAKKNAKAELVLKNANVVNVFTGEVIKGDVAIAEGIVVGVGQLIHGTDGKGECITMTKRTDIKKILVIGSGPIDRSPGDREASGRRREGPNPREEERETWESRYSL